MYFRVTVVTEKILENVKNDCLNVPEMSFHPVRVMVLDQHSDPEKCESLHKRLR